MKELIPLGDHIKKQTPTIDSREVTEIFESNHKDVLKAIRRIIERSGYSKDSARRDFTLTHYKDQSNRKQPCYSITQKGLMALVMSFPGRKSNQKKEDIIKHLHEIESELWSN